MTYFLNSLEPTENYSDMLLAIPLVFMLGLMMSFPLIFIMAAVIGTPICMLIYKLEKDNMMTFVICGGIASFIFFYYPFIKSEPFGMGESKAFSVSPFLFLEGALTGYFFYKQMEKRSIVAEKTVDGFEGNL